MKKRLPLILIIFCVGVAVLTLGKLGGEKLRYGGVYALSNVWTLFSGERSSFEELAKENRQLRKALKEIADGEKEAKSFDQKMTAQVIYRPYTHWLSSFWIDLGKGNGEGLIGMNSPVLYRGALLGIVDYVGDSQSRVLLITDSNLKPAVRVARGDPKRFLMANQIEQLLQWIPDERLLSLKSEYLPEGERYLLAKGELQGSVKPHSGTVLKGVGFNYETGDAAGSARDLRTGIPYDKPGEKGISLIQVDDLLVTSGLDGLFPEGIDVALVTDVQPLKDGDIAYEILAQALFGSAEEIREVQVLPPETYDASDVPPFIFQRKMK